MEYLGEAAMMLLPVVTGPGWDRQGQEKWAEKVGLIGLGQPK